MGIIKHLSSFNFWATTLAEIAGQPKHCTPGEVLHISFNDENSAEAFDGNARGSRHRIRR
jgi:hypothetical protein